jgi:hypothetical protein
MFKEHLWLVDKPGMFFGVVLLRLLQVLVLEYCP